MGSIETCSAPVLILFYLYQRSWVPYDVQGLRNGPATLFPMPAFVVQSPLLFAFCTTARGLPTLAEGATLTLANGVTVANGQKAAKRSAVRLLLCGNDLFFPTNDGV